MPVKVYLLDETAISRDAEERKSQPFAGGAISGPTWTTVLKYMGSGQFHVQTKIDAVNSFGAKLCSKLDCEVQCDAERNCIVTGVREM